MRLQEHPKRRPAVNMTSLIDVLFLLLTFFLVTTQFMDQAALKVELPEMSHADRVQQVRRFILNLDAEGHMTLDGELISSDVLQGKLKASAAQIDESGGLVMRADKRLPYGDVMEILDLIRGAGIKRIANATADPPR